MQKTAVIGTVAFMKPLIGITGRQFPYGDVQGAPEVLGDALVDAVLVDYVDAVLYSGGIPVHIPMQVRAEEIIGRLDGLVLSGGADIDPANYGSDPDPDLGPVETERDTFELELTRLAISTEMPTLGICRGNQMLNVAAGGTLHQHLPEHARFDSPAGVEVHSVSFDADSTVAATYGATLEVNSFHHQTIDQLGEGIRVVGRDGDGSIEAIEFDNKPIVGIQWHPEMFRRQDPIFDWLIARSCEGAGEKAHAQQS